MAGLLAWGTGELEEAEHVCAQAVELFRQADEDRRALLATNELSTIHGLRGDFAAWRASAEAALAAAVEHGERGIIVQALGNVGIACWHQADFDAAEPAVSRCVDLVREDAKPHRLCLSLLNVAASRTFEGSLDGVAALVEEAKSVNPGYRDSQVPEYEIFIGFVAGDFAGSLEAAHTAYVTNPSRPGPRRGFALGLAALSALEHDSLGLAEHFLARSRAVYGDREYFIFTDYRAWAEGLLACRLGRSEGRATMRETADRLLVKGALGIAGMVLADLLEWEAGGGDDKATAEAAERLHAIAAQIRRPLYSGLAAIARAESLLLDGDPDEAPGAAREALHLLSATGCRGYQGRAADLLGRTLSGTDRSGAVDALEQAALIFEDCGATYRRDRTLEALRSLRGRGGRVAAGVTGPASLSKRERQVACLAGQGMTAGGIAAELFISERTVEGHLANVYAKLGVSSKLELVRRAEEFAL